MWIPPFAAQERLNERARIALAKRELVAPVRQADPPDDGPRPAAIGVPDLADLAAQLREIAEVRADLVKEARRRADAGFYFTREAAERAATEILDAKDFASDMQTPDAIPT